MPNSPSLRVLLAEDSSLLAARLAELIRRLPDVDLIETVDTEAGALGSIAGSQPDVVILDLHLRTGSGFGVLRSLARAGHRPKVVVLTNFGLPEYRHEAELFWTNPATTSACPRCCVASPENAQAGTHSPPPRSSPALD